MKFIMTLVFFMNFGLYGSAKDTALVHIDAQQNITNLMAPKIKNCLENCQKFEDSEEAQKILDFQKRITNEVNPALERLRNYFTNDNSLTDEKLDAAQDEIARIFSIIDAIDQYCNLISQRFDLE